MNEMHMLLEVIRVLKETFHAMDGKEVSQSLFDNIVIDLNKSLGHLMSEENMVNLDFVVHMFNTLVESGVIDLVETPHAIVIKYNFSPEELAQIEAEKSKANNPSQPVKYETYDEYEKSPAKSYDDEDDYRSYEKPARHSKSYDDEDESLPDSKYPEGATEYVYMDILKVGPDIDAEFIDTLKFHSLQSAREFATLNIEPPYSVEIYVNEVVPTTVKKKLY